MTETSRATITLSISYHHALALAELLSADVLLGKGRIYIQQPQHASQHFSLFCLLWSLNLEMRKISYGTARDGSSSAWLFDRLDSIYFNYRIPNSPMRLIWQEREARVEECTFETEFIFFQKDPKTG
jgi:hypothetical protein